MNYRKEINIINKLLIDLYHCVDSEEFYQLSTKLYYHINCVVFGLEVNLNDKDVF